MRYYEENGIKYPSVTSILQFYPKGEGFYSWLKRVGNKADEIRDSAAEKGHLIHEGINKYLKKEEYEADEETERFINQFKEWSKGIDIIDTEKFVINKDIGYAGTADLIVNIRGVKYLIDIKTSNYIHNIHKLQVSAYKHGGHEDCKLAILHLKSDSFEFIEVEDSFEIFLAVKRVFDFESQK